MNILLWITMIKNKTINKSGINVVVSHVNIMRNSNLFPVSLSFTFVGVVHTGESLTISFSTYTLAMYAYTYLRYCLSWQINLAVTP